jgi:glycosyltransferase involved in cell wall biosynthesis
VSTASYFVSVVVPMADDADLLEPFIVDLLGVLRAGWQNYEVVLVDDGSRDATREVSLQLLERFECLRYLRLSKRVGTEVAMLAGLDGVIGDVIVVLQPESDPPELLPRFVEAAHSSGGVAFGVRTTRSEQGFAYRALRRRFVRVAARMLDLELPVDATLYMAFTRQALNAVGQIKDKSRALRIFGAIVGFPRQQIAYAPIPRRTPVRSKSLGEGLERGISLIVTNTTRPLRYVALLGLFASVLNALYLVYVLLIALFKTRVAEGWITQSASVSGMFLFLFLILSVLAEYVGRLLEESRDRPSYFVAEERQSSVLIADVTRRNVVNESV